MYDVHYTLKSKHNRCSRCIMFTIHCIANITQKCSRCIVCNIIQSCTNSQTGEGRGECGQVDLRRGGNGKSSNWMCAVQSFNFKYYRIHYSMEGLLSRMYKFEPKNVLVGERAQHMYNIQT